MKKEEKLRKQLIEAIDYIDALNKAIEEAGDVVEDIIYDNIRDTKFNYDKAFQTLLETM